LKTVERINVSTAKCAEDLILCSGQNQHVHDLAATYSRFRVENESYSYLCRTGSAGTFLFRLGGLFAPQGTPREIIAKLNEAAVEALADPVLRDRLADLGLKIFPRERQTPEGLAALQKADAGKWWPIIKELGIKAE
jgi:Tripartite tricarboxylate transporter family receptor